MRELIKLCKKEKILGSNCTVGKYYVSFRFEPKAVYCKECGKQQ